MSGGRECLGRRGGGNALDVGEAGLPWMPGRRGGWWGSGQVNVTGIADNQ